MHPRTSERLYGSGQTPVSQCKCPYHSKYILSLPDTLNPPPPPPPFLKSVWSPSLRDEFVWAAVQEWVSLPAGAGGRAGGRAVGAVPRGLAAVLRLHWAGRRPPQRRRRPRAPVAAAALAPPPATVVQQPLGGMGSTNVDSGGADDFGPQRMNFSFKSERSVQLCCAQPRPPGSLDLR